MDATSFVDGFGRRQRASDPVDGEVETLRLCRELSEAASTEPALLERAGKLADFAHPAFAQVRRVERSGGALGGLSIVSTATDGTRLSEVLKQAHRKWVAPDLDAARCLLGQITNALADLHRYSRDVAHGSIGPERVVVRPDGTAVIVEHVLAPALEQLQMGRAQLWTDFRVPVPMVAGTTRFDQATDVMQIGMLALALVLGRPVRREEYPNQLRDLLATASTPDPLGERQAVSRGLRFWILRTFQFEARSAFRTAVEAATAFEALLAEESIGQPSPAAVVAYVEACASGSHVAPSKAAAEPAAPPAEPPVVVRPAPPVPEKSDRLVQPPSPAPDRSATVRVVRHSVARPPQPVMDPARAPHSDAGDAGQPFHRLTLRAAGAMHASVAYVRKLDWTAPLKSARVTTLSIALVALYGVTYLGARGYLGLPGLTSSRGTLVVESRPAGIDLYVDGFPSGQTPATLDLRAGEHTLVLRTGKGITLVPVMVVAGARKVEFIEVRQRRLGHRPQPAAAPVAPPTQTTRLRTTVSN